MEVTDLLLPPGGALKVTPSPRIRWVEFSDVERSNVIFAKRLIRGGSLAAVAAAVVVLR